jgi:hypothetical protein
VNETKQDFSNLSSIELARKVRMFASQLQIPGKEELLELLRRFEGYTQIQAGPLPPRKAEDTLEHERHVEQLANAVQFYASVSRVLDSKMLIDHTQPFEKIAEGLGSAIDIKNKRHNSLIAIIGEIYCGGGVRFDPLALPEEIGEVVESLMKKRGLIK